jgi:D-3-phosphoglycerate dehydrogenase / 2-oxoglutarate reductase
LSVERVLILEPTPHTDTVCAILGPGLHIVRGPFSQRRLIESITQCDAIFARLGHQLDDALFSRAEALKVIATPTTGLTHIDVAAADRRGIDILCLRGERELLEQLPATAELTWGLLLAVVRRIVPASRHTLGGHWNRDQFWCSELAGKTLGILGYGRIGSMVARYAMAFGMKVIAYDTISETSTTKIRFVDKRTLFSESNVISVHAHYNQGEPPLIGPGDFEVMQPGTVLINTARGELVDEAALIHSLRTGRLSGVGLDVLANEPPANTELLQLQGTHNVVITPHVGGATVESIEKTEIFMAHKLRAYLDRYRTVGA